MVIRCLRLLAACYFLISCGEVWPKTYAIEGDLIGEINYYTLKKNESLAAVARRFDIGLVELLAANPALQRNRPKADSVLTITTQHILPVPRHGIVLNLSELRLFYFINATQVMTVPMSIGKEGWQTPLGVTEIVRKRENPDWIPTDAIRRESPHLPSIVPAGPDNPLGLYALNLGWPNYAIHGTNRPYSVGKRASHGCIRLYPEDIEALFKAVEIGTAVTVIDSPYKLGWQGSQLFLEVTPTQQQSDALIQYRQLTPVDTRAIYEAIQQNVLQHINQRINIDWKAVDIAVMKRTGLPVLIGELLPLKSNSRNEVLSQ